MGQEALNEKANANGEDAIANGEDEQALLNSRKVSKPEEERLSSSSTSSDSSSEKNFVQLDVGEPGKPTAGTESIHRTNSTLPHHAGEDASLPSPVTQDGGVSTPNSLSSRLDARDPDDDSDPLGVKESPPAQVMTRSDVPDPLRIPSTVFDRSKSTTPMNWSVASNESLFSIHAGNSSFSRDHVFLMGRSGELSNFPSPGAQPSYPTVLEPVETKENMGNRLEQAVTTEVANAKAMKDAMSATADGHVSKEKPSIGSIRRSTSTSRQSDASIQSFAFPILEGGGTSMKVEPESQPQPQKSMKAADHKEAPEAVPGAAKSQWFSCCSCFSCS